MEIYIVTIIASVMFAMVADYSKRSMIIAREIGKKKPESNKRWILFVGLSALIPFLVSALRYGIGTDYFYTYVPKYYYYYSNPDAPMDWEPLFWLLCKSLARFTSNPQWMFAIASAIIVCCVWYSVYKISSIPWFSILLFFISRQFFVSMNAVRQYIGLSLVLIGITFIKNKKYWLYILFVAIGTMFHYSTVLFAPLLLMAFVPVKPIESTAIIGFFSVFSNVFYSFIRMIVMLTPYAKYIGTEFDTADRYNPWTIFELLLVHIIISILIDRDPIRENEVLLRFLYNTHVVCLLISFNLHLIPNGERISWSFEIPSILLIPEMITRMKDRKEKIIVICLIITVYSYVMYNRIKAGNHQVYPYFCIPSLSVFFQNLFATA